MQQKARPHRPTIAVVVLTSVVAGAACSSEPVTDPPRPSTTTLTVRSHADQLEAFGAAHEMFRDRLALTTVAAVEVTADGVRAVSRDRAVPPGIVAIVSDDQGFVVWHYQDAGEGYATRQIWISSDAARRSGEALEPGLPMSISARHGAEHTSIVGTVARVEERGGAS